jgi:hypothetical protein
VVHSLSGDAGEKIATILLFFSKADSIEYAFIKELKETVPEKGACPLFSFFPSLLMD